MVGPGAGAVVTGAGVGETGAGVGAGVGRVQQVVGLKVPAGRFGLQVQTPWAVQLVEKVQVPCPQQPEGQGLFPGHCVVPLQTKVPPPGCVTTPHPVVGFQA